VVHPDPERAPAGPALGAGLEVKVMRALEAADPLVVAPEHVCGRAEELEVVRLERFHGLRAGERVVRVRPGATLVRPTSAVEVQVSHSTPIVTEPPGRCRDREEASIVYAWRPMGAPTTDDVDALVGPATPQFAYQLRARVRELVADLPEDDPVRVYAESKAELLDRLGLASTKAENSEPESRARIGWETIPSSATASHPLPRGEQ
jgi:hypothetical protein